MVPRRPRGGLQAELLHLLQPRVPRREQLVSERVAPTLADIGDSMVGRPADEVLAALAAAVRNAGSSTERTALRGSAAQIDAGDNAFA